MNTVRLFCVFAHFSLAPLERAPPPPGSSACAQLRLARHPPLRGKLQTMRLRASLALALALICAVQASRSRECTGGGGAREELGELGAPSARPPAARRPPASRTGGAPCTRT